VGDLLYTQALAGGAQACGVPIGQLATGYRADWLVLDGDDPYLAAANDGELLNRWLFAGSSAQIRDVFVGGIAKVINGQHPQQRTASADFLALLQLLAEDRP